MTVFDAIYEKLNGYGIYLCAPIPLGECKIIRPYLLERAGLTGGSAVMIAVPYLVDDKVPGNISEYAKSRDYHLFFSEMFGKIIPGLSAAFPSEKFAGFCDHSPIDEINAAAKAGLGVIGDNGLLLTEKYSSFVFIGEIITSASTDRAAGEIGFCEKCGRCAAACPGGSDKSLCLSAITQKKGELTDEEKRLILEHGSAWGCDVCQNICPYTERAKKNGTITSPVGFFREARVPYLTLKLLDSMSDGEFSCRAFSWRGREVIARNLGLLENQDEKK